MKIIHQIGAKWKDIHVKELSKLGILVNRGVFSYVVLEENVYLSFKGLFNGDEFIQTVGTEYSKNDLNNANWLILDGIKETGFPQPEEDFGYLEKTYDLINYCKDCGTGNIQNSFFRIKKEPKWGSKKVFQLSWIYDELFVEIEFYNRFFKPLGLAAKPVFLHKSDKECKTVIQLDIPRIGLSLDMKDTSFADCSSCNKRKYSPQIKGFAPKYDDYSNYKIFKGSEFYGTGKQTYNRIYINQSMRKELIVEKIIKPWQLIPLES